MSKTSATAGDRATAKQAIAKAEKLAKAAGVSVMATNDKPGKEYIGLNGDGDKLAAVKGQLEEAGWHAWPRNEEQEGWMMEFSLAPAPAAPEPLSGNSSSEEQPADLPEPGDSFYYQGPGSVSSPTLIFPMLLVVMPFWVNPHLSVLDLPVKLALSAGGALLAAALILPLAWVKVTVDTERLTIRKHFIGKPREYPVKDIKRARMITEKMTRGGTAVYIGIDLTGGKAFDIFLPARRLRELLAFLRANAPLLSGHGKRH